MQESRRTVREIAREAGVTKTTIRQRASYIPHFWERYAERDAEGVLWIDAAGASLLMETRTDRRERERAESKPGSETGSNGANVTGSKSEEAQTDNPETLSERPEQEREDFKSASGNTFGNNAGSNDESILRLVIEQNAEQSRAKDRQIEALSREIEALTEQIGKLSDALTAAQALHAGTMQERIEAAAESRQGRSKSQDGNEGTHGADQTQDAGPERKERRGIFGKIFRR